jgi:hypothetical protein
VVPFFSLEFWLLVIALFVWIISHQPAVLFSQSKTAITNQPAVFFLSEQTSTSHQPPAERTGYMVVLPLQLAIICGASCHPARQGVFIL